MSTGVKSVQTAGQLREFLVSMMVGVKNGDIDPEKARGIVKLAGQVTENFYAEIKIAKVRMEAGHKLHELGALPINGAPEPKEQ